MYHLAAPSPASYCTTTTTTSHGIEASPEAHPDPVNFVMQSFMPPPPPPHHHHVFYSCVPPGLFFPAPAPGPLDQFTPAPFETFGVPPKFFISPTLLAPAPQPSPSTFMPPAYWDYPEMQERVHVAFPMMPYLAAPHLSALASSSPLSSPSSSPLMPSGRDSPMFVGATSPVSSPTPDASLYMDQASLLGQTHHITGGKGPDAPTSPLRQAHTLGKRSQEPRPSSPLIMQPKRNKAESRLEIEYAFVEADTITPTDTVTTILVPEYAFRPLKDTANPTTTITQDTMLILRATTMPEGLETFYKFLPTPLPYQVKSKSNTPVYADRGLKHFLEEQLIKLSKQFKLLTKDMITCTQEEAAHALGVSSTRLCRKWVQTMAYRKWPHRTHAKIERELQQLRTTYAATSEADKLPFVTRRVSDLEAAMQANMLHAFIVL
eukprot:TRINITY_DN700_c0_g1_i1.p1 TRINITY_DN700_c0_g1~~TRINITY_DN700_c0_g1_i1.p1  ORF type:complete len:434 (-),score=111.33 TRINITY_DN700_c0_g1_i1:93-1394(-)